MSIDTSSLNKTLENYSIKYVENDDDERAIVKADGENKVIDKFVIYKGNRQIRAEKVNEKQTRQNLLSIPLYNYMIISNYFKNIENVHICHSAFNADETIKALCKKFIDQHVPKSDITIISFDTDMWTTGVLVQNESFKIDTSKI